MNGLADKCPDNSEFVETDPSGRYLRYNEILGKGASKTVYRAFDEYQGVEVAWNKVKLDDFLQSPENLERLHCEINLLKTLNHDNIIKFHASWIDTAHRNINFITEMSTSGTLRQYRLKHKRVNIRAIKNWCRQILQGLLYLHSHDPPVIHRDLKCDNIFVNGNLGEVKIGDLGLAEILGKSYACVGTPEFMAPEVYEEEYDEMADVYSFGMCVLEMATFEYPYSECANPAQIYKKVVSGKKPDALYRVQDIEMRTFVEKCLAKISNRSSVWELLNNPFLQIDDDYYNDELDSTSRQPLVSLNRLQQKLENDFCSGDSLDYYEAFDANSKYEDADMSIKGRPGDDGNVFLRIRISDNYGCIRNIYFTFDVENDTALSVAAEMVGELDITDQDVAKIAELIGKEIAPLVPEESPSRKTIDSCPKNCSSDEPPLDIIITPLQKGPGKGARHVRQCSKHEFHGRFEEFTYEFDGSEEQCVITDNAPIVSSSSQSEDDYGGSAVER